MIDKILKILGGVVLVLFLAGALGIGHFRLYYGKDNVQCNA